MSGRITWQRHDPRDIHKLLYAATADVRELDAEVADDEGWVQPQALFCPYYATLDGTLGADWGVIVNPDSKKFARLVFEHEWCGCPWHEGPLGDILTDHGSGDQAVDEWALPKSARKNYRFWLRHRRRREREEAAR